MYGACMKETRAVRISRTVADAIDRYRKDSDTPNLSRNAAAEVLLKAALRQVGIDPNARPADPPSGQTTIGEMTR